MAAISLNLKPNNKAVKDYYVGLEEFAKLGVTHQAAVPRGPEPAPALLLT